jgi:hypothetical protein
MLLRRLASLLLLLTLRLSVKCSSAGATSCQPGGRSTTAGMFVIESCIPRIVSRTTAPTPGSLCPHKVQSEAGVEQWGQLVVGYSSANERVEIPFVRVLKADG